MNKNDMEQLILSDKDDRENCRFQSKAGMRGISESRVRFYLSGLNVFICVCVCACVFLCQ